MKARVVPLDSDEHRLAQDLLPWFVSKTLGADEAAQVGAHVAQCARCQGDVAAQVRLRDVATQPETVVQGIEPAWAAMRAKLDAAVPPAAIGHAPRRWGWQPGLRFAVAMQVAVIVAGGALWLGGASRSEPYRGLGAAPLEANALAVFRADASEAQMRAALRAAGARIVGGPTVTDAYLLRLGDAGPAALERLRSQPGVLRAESLQGEMPQ